MKLLKTLICILTITTAACADITPTSNSIQAAQSEMLLKEATAQVGMPAIKNFRERKLLKDILELRDQDGLTTYTYTFAENSGKLTFLCTSVGYGIPYATQFTSPEMFQRVSASGGGYTYQTLPQADPNGLFSPVAADGTWVQCLDPITKTIRPIYSEPKLIVSPWQLTTN